MCPRTSYAERFSGDIDTDRTTGIDAQHSQDVTGTCPNIQEIANGLAAKLIDQYVVQYTERAGWFGRMIGDHAFHSLGQYHCHAALIELQYRIVLSNKI
jgi:hypothetical protein